LKIAYFCNVDEFIFKMKTREEKEQLIRNLKALLREQFGDNILDVILFGSQIKGTSTEFSDYDVMIVLKNHYDWKYRKKVNHAIYDLEVKNDVLFDTHLVSKYELEHTLKGIEPIYQNAIKQGIYA
jgi:predicted nucleotidyltransferase